MLYPKIDFSSDIFLRYLRVRNSPLIPDSVSPDNLAMTLTTREGDNHVIYSWRISDKPTNQFYRKEHNYGIDI